MGPFLFYLLKDVEMELAKKLIRLQFDAIFDIYREWIDLAEHIKLVPRDKNIRFDATLEQRMAVMKFVVTANGQEVTFTSACIGGSWTNSQIDTGGRIATYGELVDLLSNITTEMYYQLQQYAIRNNFPPENVMH